MEPFSSARGLRKQLSGLPVVLGGGPLRIVAFLGMAGQGGPRGPPGAARGWWDPAGAKNAAPTSRRGCFFLGSFGLGSPFSGRRVLVFAFAFAAATRHPPHLACLQLLVRGRRFQGAPKEGRGRPDASGLLACPNCRPRPALAVPLRLGRGEGSQPPDGREPGKD